MSVFFYSSTGSLMCEKSIPGLTQAMGERDGDFYGGRYFIGETINPEAAKILISALDSYLGSSVAEHTVEHVKESCDRLKVPNGWIYTFFDSCGGTLAATFVKD